MKFWKEETAAKTLGQLGEELAQEEYKKQGFKIIETNFFNDRGKRMGEIDFIAEKKDVIAFVEVKTRTENNRFGTGQEAVDYFKQQKILKAVKIFLLQNKQYHSLKPQIDVCVVELHTLDKKPPSVTILSNAVEDSN